MLYLKHVLESGVWVTLRDDGDEPKPFVLSVGAVKLTYMDFRDAMEDFTGTLAYEF